MFVFGNILMGFTKVLDTALNIYMWVIIISALISWVNPDPYNQIVRFLTRITEPVLRPIRRIAPPYRIGLDLSPLIAILAIVFLQYALINTLYRIARSMG
jgi:YggT family protein